MRIFIIKKCRPAKKLEITLQIDIRTFRYNGLLFRDAVELA